LSCDLRVVSRPVGPQQNIVFGFEFPLHNRRRWSGGPLREGGRRQEQYRAEPTGALREVKSHGCRCNLFVPRRSAWIFARPCIHLFQAPYEHVFGVDGHHGLFERETKEFWGLQSQLGRSGRRRRRTGLPMLNGFGYALPIQRSKIQCPFQRSFDWGETYLRGACLVLKLPFDG
jgi:hypothetical protein